MWMPESQMFLSCNLTKSDPESPNLMSYILQTNKAK